MVGGCLEYLGLIVGFPGLLVIAALVYGGALALMPRGARLGAESGGTRHRELVT
jgi:hypothetical protein